MNFRRNHPGGGNGRDGACRVDGQGLPRGLLRVRGVRHATDGRARQAMLPARRQTHVP